MNYILQNKESHYYEVIDKIIDRKKEEILSFFNSGDIELNFNIYVYNSIEDLVKGLRDRGFSNDPDYMCACHKDEDNSLNFFEPKDNPSDNEWSKEEYEKVIFHELIHGIQYTLFGTTPEWLNEGIAKYLDGTYSKGIKWLLNNYINNSPIPNQSEIENEFGMHEYDSYDYAYLMVSYLIDKYSKDKLIEILSNIKTLDEYKNDLLKQSIDYFNKKYSQKNVIIYDFDGTLTPFSLPKFDILEKSGYKDGAYNREFLEMTRKNAEKSNTDLYSALYNMYFEAIKKANFSLTDDNFSLGSLNVTYNPGVEDYLNMLNMNNISNYLLSSGIKVYLENVSIAHYFKEIYATTFKYNDNNEATGIDFLMSDKNKVIAIKDIIKKIGNNEDDCSNIIYIGDGLTDYYAMKYVKENGGISIFVCDNFENKDYLTIKDKNVVDYFTTRDYSDNSELRKYVKDICNID